MAKKVPSEATLRVLSPEEYPVAITASRGALTPKVLFAVQHPQGLYHVEDQGAGTHATYFTSRRAKRPTLVAMPRSMAGAFRAISRHEDKLLHPEVARETGRHGAVSIHALGERTGTAKPKSQLDSDLDAWLIAHGYSPLDGF